MENLDNYKELKRKLETLSSNWDKQQGWDATYINVAMYGKEWRKRKKLWVAKKIITMVGYFSVPVQTLMAMACMKKSKLSSPYKDLLVTERNNYKNNGGAEMP